MSDEPTERDVEALAEVLWNASPRHGSVPAARAFLASDWYAERIAQARREGAALGRRAILDPGAFVERGADYDGNAYGERLDQWQARATAAALRGDA